MDISESKLFSFNEIAKKATLINGVGNVVKERKRAYHRELNVFNMLHEDADNLDDPIVEDAEDFIQKYCFAPTRNNTSLADHLVGIRILSDDYSISDHRKYLQYLSVWEEWTEKTVFEKVDSNVIEDFKNHFIEINQSVIDIPYNE